MLSSNCQPETTNVQRKQKDGTRIQGTCPKSIVSYNQYMGGVERGDQLRQYYHVRYTSHKNYKYIFWFLFDVAVTNSYILLRHYGTRNRLTSKEFRIELAKSLIGDYNSRKIRGRPSSSSIPNPIRPPCPIKHFPVKKNKTSSKKGVSRCWHCNHKRRETFWYCTECNKYLCHTGDHTTDCFLIYHQELDLIS